MTLVIFTSSPNGCYVYMDGFKIGTAPFTTQLDPGQYNFEYRKSGYDTVKKKFVIFAPEVMPAQSIFLSLSKSKEPPPEEEEEPEEEEKEYKVSVISAKAVGKEKLDVDFTVENKGNVRDKFYITIYHTTDPKFDVTETTSYCDPNERDNENFNNISNPYPDRIKYKIKSKKGNKIIKTGTIKSPKWVKAPPPEIEELPAWVKETTEFKGLMANMPLESGQGSIFLSCDPEVLPKLYVNGKDEKVNTPVIIVGKVGVYEIELKHSSYKQRKFKVEIIAGKRRQLIISMVKKPIPEDENNWWNALGGFMKSLYGAKEPMTPHTLYLETGKVVRGLPPIIGIAGPTAAAKTSAPGILTGVRNVLTSKWYIAGILTIFAITEFPQALMMAHWVLKDVPKSIRDNIEARFFALKDLFWTIKTQLSEGKHNIAKINLGLAKTELDDLRTLLETGTIEGESVKAALESIGAYESTIAVLNTREAEYNLLLDQLKETKEPTGIKWNVLGPDTFTTDTWSDKTWKYGDVFDIGADWYRGMLKSEGYEDLAFTVAVEPGKISTATYTMELTPGEIPVEKARLIITIRDTDTDELKSAYLWINDIKQSGYFSSYTIDSDPGLINIRIERTGYERYEYPVEVIAGQKWEGVFEITPITDVVPENVEIIFRTNEDCEIEIEGYITKFTENQKAAFNLPPGWYKAILRKDEYETKTFTFTVRVDSPESYPITLEKTEAPWEPPEELPKEKSYLQFNITGPGIFTVSNFPDIEMGYGFVKEVMPGEYKGKISAEGFKSEEYTQFISEGETKIVDITLTQIITEELPVKWRVDVDSLPSGGKILIDGQFTGEWTPGYIILNPGMYMVSVVKTGYIPAEAEITLEED